MLKSPATSTPSVHWEQAWAISGRRSSLSAPPSLLGMYMHRSARLQPGPTITLAAQAEIRESMADAGSSMGWMVSPLRTHIYVPPVPPARVPAGPPLVQQSYAIT